MKDHDVLDLFYSLSILLLHCMLSPSKLLNYGICLIQWIIVEPIWAWCGHRVCVNVEYNFPGKFSELLLCNRGLRFMCCFRFKLWWMTQRMGTCGKDIPLETQFLLVESKEPSEGEHDDSPTIYTAFLPLLEGQFRAVLQGNEKNELEICLESGE